MGRIRILVFFCILCNINLYGQKVLNDNCIEDNFPDFLKELYIDNNINRINELFVEKVNCIEKRSSNELNDKILNNIAKGVVISKQFGYYEIAEKFYLLILSIYDRIYIDEITYAIFIDNLALFYAQDIKDLQKAEFFNLKALKIFSRLRNEYNKDYLISLKNLALVYNKQRRYSESESLFLEILDEATSNNKYNSESYYFLLTNIGELYKNMNEYKKSESFYLDAIEFGNKLKIKSIKAQFELALLYSKYKPEKSILVLEELLEKMDNKSKDLPLVLSALAKVKTDQLNYSEVESLYKRADSLFIKHYNKFNGYTLTNRRNLALYYLDIGEYSKADDIFQEIEKPIINLYGLQSLEYAQHIELRALIYRGIGDYDKSKSLVTKAALIKIDLLNENDPELANSYNNLAHILLDNEEYHSAIELFEVAKRIYKNNDNIELFSTVIRNIGTAYFEKGDLTKSVTYYEEAYTIRTQNKLDIRIDINNLFVLYYELGRYNDCLKLVKEFGGNRYNITDFNDLNSLINISYLYYKINNLKELTFYLEDFFETYNYNLEKFNHHFTPNSLENFLIEDIWKAYSLFYSSLSFNESIVLSKLFENNLILKSASLRNQTRIRQTILEKGDQKTKELYQSYINNTNQLIQLETDFTEASFAEYKRLSEINENIEKELIKHSAEFADAQKDLQIQWTDLRDKLAPNEAIVDLVSFNLFEDKWTDKIQYAAFIVRNNSEQPEFVSLFEEKELTSLLSLQNLDSIYQSEKFYQLFIKPIENKLSGINTLYYSPSGLAHQVDFSAIALPGDDQMLDKYKIHLLSTPAQLRKFKELALYSNSEIILFGDIDYDKESAQNTKKELNETELHSFSDLLTRSGIGGWGYLPGTKKEVELIEHFAKEKLINTKVYKGSEATKESLMALSGKTEPFVLHLATHGFFFENTVQELPENFLSTRSFNQMVQVSANPMLRSGLVLSGANKSWHKDTSGDGIITAAEIANLDLRNCDLVVLSACDTGLGDINGSEGVFGLQRAFKLAGVKNIIMSLWKVPDEQTSEMFQLFYQELLNGKSIHQSFVEAQTKMKENYSPYYWAGFVLLE